MNHCIIDAADRRHSHEQGLRDSREIIIESHANGIIAQLQDDFLTITGHTISNAKTMKVSQTTIALLNMLCDSDDLYAMAEQIATTDLERSNDA